MAFRRKYDTLIAVWKYGYLVIGEKAKLLIRAWDKPANDN